MGSLAELILVVDDDPTIRVTIAEVLEEEGYRVAQAPDGSAALDAIERECPALVMLDMRMPVMDGWTFARKMREGGCDVPIVVMTAATDARRNAADVGAAGHLAKPFNIEAALDLVARVLARPAAAGTAAL